MDCVREQGGNMAEECGQLFMDMNECMLKHKDYYAPIPALHVSNVTRWPRRG